MSAPAPNGRSGFDPSRLPLRSSRLLYESQSYRVVARWVVGIFVAIVLAAFLPWQQNVQGYGQPRVVSIRSRCSEPRRFSGRAGTSSPFSITQCVCSS